jgi:hypothetical protein
MKTSRNDPCPCGSGKKYKACCMGRDQARGHARSIIGEEAFGHAEAEWLALAREQAEWAVEIAPAPGGVREDPNAGLSLVMVTAGEWVAHAEVLARRPAGPSERARDMVAAVEAAGRALGRFPERLNVPDNELVEPMASALAGRGITVSSGDSEDLWEAMNAALAHMDPSPVRGRVTVALTWRETEATAEELRDFHQAAADFFTAAPWALEGTEGLFLLDLPRDPEEKPIPEFGMLERRQWAASVMGSMGQSFGLVLHSQRSDLVEIFRGDDPAAAFTEPMGFAITVDFDRKAELTRTMQREIAAARWPIAAPHAYPRLFGMHLPGRRVVARDVRLAAQALRAIAVFARGGDPLAETGVGVTPFDPDAEDESRLDWFHVPDEAAPVGAEGPGVETPPRFHVWDAAEQRERAAAAEQERIGRFSAWLGEQGVPEEEMEADLENADSWRWFVAGVGSAGAVTEFDLRLFVFDVYVRKADPTPQAVRALPRSMRRIVRWLEEREGVRYPFAPGVLDELERIEVRGRELGEPLEETLRILSYDIYDSLDMRAMICSSDLPGVPGGWPDLMTPDVARLREELQRRWLAWYDELVRGGMTDYGALEDALEARQRQWENAPHPRVEGRTPAQVVAAQAV